MKSDRDRITLLERRLGELDQRTRGLPVRIGDAAAGVGGGDPTPTGNFILVDFDFGEIQEADPPDLLTTDGIELTDDEVDAGYSVIFQDPPDADFDANNLDNLRLMTCKPGKVTVKYFISEVNIHGVAHDGDTSTVTLAEGSSTINDFYVGGTITLHHEGDDDQVRTITGFVGSTLIATVDSPWDVMPNGSGDFSYDITSTELLTLETTIVDDPDHLGEGDEPAPRKIVRYATRTVSYIDGEAKDFEREEYTRSNYDSYPEDEFFPPDGTGTYQEMPAGYFKKTYRAATSYRLGREWIDYQTCIELPPPPLVPVEEE